VLSIIIPTAGRGQTLPNALRSAHDECQSVDDPTEVIVIDNNIDKELVRCIRLQCEAADGSIRYVREASPGLTTARHRGAEEASGDLLVFLDDDVTLGRGWLRGMLDGFADTSVGIVGGPSIPRFDGSVPSWFWHFVTPSRYGGWQCTWVSLLDIGKPVEDIHPNYIWGLNFGIRGSVLRELGGFHPDLVPTHLQRWQGDGETGLTMKAYEAGVKARYVPEALLYHYVGPDRLTTRYFERRARYQGICDSFTQIRAGKLPADVVPNASPSPKRDGRLWERFASEVCTLIDQAYMEGFEYHRREAADDPRLVEWARRETFWGADNLAEMDSAEATL
jgi:glycosyltransferase involved in cell wall biosynthesis